MRKAIDPSLLADCLANDQTALRELYDRSFPHLNFMVGRYLDDPGQREDVLQETYLRLFRHLSTYDARRAGFTTWAGRIAINCCLRRNAAGRRDRTETLDGVPHTLTEPPVALDRLTDEALVRWLRQLPPDLYTVFSLRAVDEYSHREIAAELGISVDLSRQRYRRARQWLRTALRQQDTPLTDRLRARGDLQLAPLLSTLYLLTQS